MMTIEGCMIMFDGHRVGIFTGTPSQRMQIEDKLNDVQVTIDFLKGFDERVTHTRDVLMQLTDSIQDLDPPN